MSRHREIVAEYYDRHVDEEWRRLKESWLEFSVTLHFVTDMVPANGRILDLGGGPGRYALALARLGYKVDLIDLSSVNVGRALAEARRAGLSFGSARTGDAIDLSGIEGDLYDAVLNLGPLYHLVEADLRRLCIDETARILRPGGLGFFAFLSTYAPVHYAAKQADRFQAMLPQLGEIAGQPSYDLAGGSDFFTEAYFVHPERVSAEFAASGLVEKVVFGAESLFAQSEPALRRRPEEERAEIATFAARHAADAAARYTSEHLVFVGQKPE